MKKAVSLLFIILVLTIFPMGGSLLAAWANYKIIHTSVEALTIIMVVLSVLLTLVMHQLKEKATSPLVNVLFAVIVPLALVNSIYLVLCGNIKWIVGLGMSINVVLMIICMIRMGPSDFRTLLTLGVMLLTLPVLVMCLLRLALGPLSQNTVVDMVSSPVSDKYAEIVKSDHGGMGGSTYVQVYESKGTNLFFFYIQKEPERIYTGKFDEKITVSWNEKDNLIVNSQEYMIGK